jgi:hypothetical protein
MGSSAFVKSPQLEHIHARLSSRSARVTTLSGKPMRLVICFLLMPEKCSGMHLPGQPVVAGGHCLGENLGCWAE